MKIEFGKVFTNKTWRFLRPIVRGYGEVFVDKFVTQVQKLAYGIKDNLLDGAKILEGKRPIFIMLDSAVNPRQFSSFMDWLKYQPYFITDYCPDMENNRLHMIVLEAPEQYHKAYDKFCVGLYSEMFTPEELDKLIDDKTTVAYKVMSRDSKYSNIFLKKVEKEFNVSLQGTDKKEFLEYAELEFPYSLTSEDEIFNS